MKSAVSPHKLLFFFSKSVPIPVNLSSLSLTHLIMPEKKNHHIFLSKLLLTIIHSIIRYEDAVFAITSLRSVKLHVNALKQRHEN